MNANRDRLDDAIDRIAARMTNLEDDAALAGHIVAALPERSARSWRWLMPRLAVGTFAALTVAVVLRPFYDGPTGVGPAKAGHHSGSVTAAEPGHHSDSATAPEPGHRTAGIGPAKPGHHSASVDPRGVSVVYAFRRTSSGTMVDRPDHEFSLPAIEAVAALAVDALTPSELASEPGVELEPLVIADLPLTAEFPPRD